MPPAISPKNESGQLDPSLALQDPASQSPSKDSAVPTPRSGQKEHMQNVSLRRTGGDGGAPGPERTSNAFCTAARGHQACLQQMDE